ncbi:ABC transporter permease [Microaerobacter geothermalis]|uniref:ABC transporter permease n=1 Tax=Microaerobacter geothermalis TaxID=674972 RepID=UPI001F239275|nr:ABC transporter permease [Microaerobacter geothermalis]MCF6092916.1 ABC transporter permease [Microaerobacter geothermalis]
MEYILEALHHSFDILIQFNPELYQIIFLSLIVSASGVLLGSILGIPLGIILGLYRFPGHSVFIRLNYVFMGLPPVFIGLLVFLFLSRSGPIAPIFYLLYTPWAMVIAQTLLAFPIISGLTYTAVNKQAGEIMNTAIGLGASKLQAIQTLVVELRFAILAGVITGFGRVIAEVGAVMIVGGDIEGHTRVLTTAIVLETRKGNFGMALALGIVLLLLSFLINTVLYRWQSAGDGKWSP